MYACLGVTYHSHFWQNDRGLLRALAVTREWNGHRTNSQHTKLTLEKKILPKLLPVFELATFRSRVRRSNEQAIPAPWCRPKQTVNKNRHTCTYERSLSNSKLSTNVFAESLGTPIKCRESRNIWKQVTLHILGLWSFRVYLTQRNNSVIPNSSWDLEDQPTAWGKRPGNEGSIRSNVNWTFVSFWGGTVAPFHDEK